MVSHAGEYYRAAAKTASTRGIPLRPAPRKKRYHLRRHMQIGFLIQLFFFTMDGLPNGMESGRAAYNSILSHAQVAANGRQEGWPYSPIRRSRKGTPELRAENQPYPMAYLLNTQLSYLDFMGALFTNLVALVSSFISTISVVLYFLNSVFP